MQFTRLLPPIQSLGYRLPSSVFSMLIFQVLHFGCIFQFWSYCFGLSLKNGSQPKRFWLLTLGNNLSDFEKKLIHRENNFGEIFVKFLTGQEFYRNTEQLWYKTTFAHPIHFSNHRTNFAPIHFRWTSFAQNHFHAS